MRKLIKLLAFGFVIIAILASMSFVVFPNPTKSYSKKAINSAQQTVLNLRGQQHEKKYSKYEPSGDVIWGIDISHHQRTINWTELENNKPHFAFIKSTEGSSHVDTKHKEYKNKFDDLSIPTGSYHFFSYNTNGTEQAKHFLKHTNLKKGDLIPVLDVEFKNNMPDRKLIIKNINEFIEHTKKETGVTPLIYCECDFYFKYLKSNLKSECDYWISDFWREPTCEYIMWQKTDKFKHEAFKGTVDYNVFTGSVEDLDDLVIK